jgi:nucleotide-binding universal stress UspA family protein
VIAKSVSRGADRSGDNLCTRLLVPIAPGEDADRTVAEACLLAADGGLVVALVAVEVPLHVPLDAPLPGAVESGSHELLARARSIGQTYGVDLRTREVRARSAGEAVVEEAARQRADAIVVHMSRGAPLDAVTVFVLRHASCRVLVAAT